MSRFGARRMQTFDWINGAIMIVLCMIFLYPLLMTLALSFSEPKRLVNDTVYLLPKGFSFAAYEKLLSDPEILRFYLNTIAYAGGGTLLTLILTALMAYPLTKADFRGRKALNIFLIITMFFGGGMIPTYLTINTYGMIDTYWVMVIPGCVGAWNVIMFVNFFKTIPDSLSESACIDGAGHFRILSRIIVPLSKPLLATISLFTIVGHWNSYMHALIYLNTTNKMPIQIFLRRILVTMEFEVGMINADMQRLLDINSTDPRTVKAAATIITILPILCVYPFLQKYFAKGILIGAVKG